MLDGIDFGDEEQRYGTDVYSDFLNYYEQGVPKRLGEELRAAGHDVIILDFPGANGAEYIQRNAYVLIQLIQNINADLRSRGSTEKLTVIGPSMSGLVSRYALAEMERRFNDVNDPGYQQPAWNHNTRLWMSFDSPQLGANIPVGDQQWLQYYADVLEVEAAIENLKNIDRPAARQMLVHHYKSAGNTVAGAPGFRDRFQTELNNLGMPSQLRRISVVNGSLAGVRQDGLTASQKANGCDQAFRFEAKTGKIRLFYIPFLTYQPLLSTTLSTSSVRFSPDYGGSCTTFEGWTFPRLNTRRKSVTGRPGSISYDVSPGSWRPTQSTLQEEGTMTNARMDGFFKNVFLGSGHRPSQTTRFYDVIGKHCFIPTTSALALTNPNRDLGQNLSNTNLVCSGETPFDSYFAPDQNEEHIFITPANAAYIRNEIGAKTPAPVFLQAPSALCPNGGTSTFQVQGECSRLDSNGQSLFPVTYTWTLTGPAVFAGNNTQTISGPATQQTIRSTTATEGDVVLTVTAQRAGFGISAPVVYSIRVFAPAVSIWTNAGGPVCAGQLVRIDLSGFNTQGPTRWFVSNGNLSAATDTDALVEAGSGLTEVRAEQISTCDGRVISSNTATIDGTGNGPNGLPCTVRVVPPTPATYQLYPNPADSYLEVSATAGTQAAFKAVLYNGAGRPVEQALGTRGTARLRTAHLPTGLYHVVVTHGQKTERHNVAIGH